MNFSKKLISIGLSLLLWTSCSEDEAEITPILQSSGLEGEKTELQLGATITISPQINTEQLDYLWTCDEQVICEKSTLSYTPSKAGEFKIHFSATNSQGEVSCDYTLSVIQIRKITSASSAYLHSIVEFKPAPGQFCNTGFTDQKAIQGLLGEPTKSTVSLGGFGGYLSAKFDHTVLNKEGADIIVYGNAFNGNSEPGIVMVMFDRNGNGKADDTWYELAGSEYNSEKTIHNYQITYTNPGEGKDIPWSDNQGNKGVIPVNMYHNQPYYPQFIPEQESVTFTGTLLETKIDFNHTDPVHGTIIYQPSRQWGYADNFSQEYPDLKGNEFDIEWAVDQQGNSVTLPGVDFIKVYTAVNTDGKILGETSTEIRGASDISLIEK